MEGWVKWTGVHKTGNTLILGDELYIMFNGGEEVHKGVNECSLQDWIEVGWKLEEVPFELENE